MKKRKILLKKNIKKILFILLLITIILLINIIKQYIIKANINIKTKEIYLAIEETYKLETNKYIEYEVLDSDIIKLENNIITGIKKGNTKIKIKNTDLEIKVNVSDLYTIPIINNDKSYLKCNQYTKEENEYLDKVLEYKINNVGYKTRAAVVETARFLTLSFSYRIHYFYENGRLLTNGTRSYVDGEGRYYHRGLYLNESKYEEIISSLYGPTIWGCDLYTKILKQKTPNGLDCSGFISWALLNAGFDIGDRGAGISKEKTNDLDDLGEKIKINKDNLENKLYKVGDLISRDAHIGILIGFDEKYYYVAEALDYDLHVNKYTKEELLKSDWLYFINMDDVYSNNGKLTNMW